MPQSGLYVGNQMETKFRIVFIPIPRCNIMNEKGRESNIIGCCECMQETYFEFDRPVIIDGVCEAPPKTGTYCKGKCYWCKMEMNIRTDVEAKITYTDGIISPKNTMKHVHSIYEKRLSNHYGEAWGTFSPDEKDAMIRQQIEEAQKRHDRRVKEITETGGRL